MWNKVLTALTFRVPDLAHLQSGMWLKLMPVPTCLSTAARVRGTDLDSWHAEWRAPAESVAGLAEREAAAGRNETARLAYLRASTYFRTVGVVLLRLPLDPRLVASNARQTAMFRSAAALMAVPPEQIEIPFEGASLPGYF